MNVWMAVAYSVLLMVIGLLMMRYLFHIKEFLTPVGCLLGLVMIPLSIFWTNYFISLFLGLLYQPLVNLKLTHLSETCTPTDLPILIFGLLLACAIIYLIGILMIKTDYTPSRLALTFGLYSLINAGVASTKLLYLHYIRVNENNWKAIACAMAGSFLIVELYQMYSMKERNRYSVQLRFLENTVNERYENYRNLEDTIEKTEEWKKNVSERILSLEKIGDTRLNPVIDYCRELLAHAKSTEKEVFTGLPILDRMLAQNRDVLKMRGVTPSVTAKGLADCGISEYVFVSLFSEMWELFSDRCVETCPVLLLQKEDQMEITTSFSGEKKEIKKLIAKSDVFRAVLAIQEGSVQLSSYKKNDCPMIRMTIFLHRKENHIA